ncbi:MAG: dienelactone hydrolase family protein [Clostridia bacterium]|nr:dienelactone hydrolase family protein [Clostridia bacterium]
MWNDFQTSDYSGMIAETVSVPGHEGKSIHAYWSRPLGAGPHPGIVLIPHMPGWDEWCRETSRRFTEHGYSVLCPDIYQDFGFGRPTEVSSRMREAGMVHDDSVMGDAKGCLDFLRTQPGSNGKTGVIGMCSGGRHAFLAACTVEGFDAAVDCWGGGVVMKPEDLSPARPVAPIDCTERLSIPLLGIFGNEDFSPTPADVDKLEARLKASGKDYEFHRYDGAGHGIWYYDKPMYRQEAAMDSWNKTLAFFDRHLKT